MRLATLPARNLSHGLLRACALGVLERRRQATGLDHQGRQHPPASPPHRGGLVCQHRPHVGPQITRRQATLCARHDRSGLARPAPPLRQVPASGRTQEPRNSSSPPSPGNSLVSSGPRWRRPELDMTVPLLFVARRARPSPCCRSDRRGKNMIPGIYRAPCSRGRARAQSRGTVLRIAVPAVRTRVHQSGGQPITLFPGAWSSLARPPPPQRGWLRSSSSPRRQGGEANLDVGAPPPARDPLCADP